MLVQYAEKTKTRRFSSKMMKPKNNAEKKPGLKVILKKHAGRSSNGRITVRHQGGREKRFYRIVDFKRDKSNVEGKVVVFEYDPNRNVELALIQYTDGDRRYILAPQGLKLGDTVVAGERVEVKVGNSMELGSMPIGTIIHNVELKPGFGGQIGRSAGTAVTLQAKEAGYAHLKMPSTEVRMVPLRSRATVGALGNEEYKNMVLGKAGRARHMGIRPAVRGVAMDPHSHPHGGGEARSGVGRKKPMTVYGKPAVGNTRTKKKWTSKYILKRRKA